MARETKVGLLAGLAFIICFAIILSNRGRTDPLVPHSSFLPSRTDTVATAREHPTVDRTPALGASDPRSAVEFQERRRGESVAWAPPNQFGDPAASGLSPSGAASPLGYAPIVSYQRDAGEPNPPDRAAASNRFASSDHAALRAVTDPVHSASVGVDRQRSLQDHLDRLTSADTRNVPSESRLTPLSMPGSVPSTPVDSGRGRPLAAVKYTVKSGDTLYGIAREHFGSGAKRLTDAILDANRDQISDPNQIRAGMVLLLPKMTTEGETTRVQRTAHTDVAERTERGATRTPSTTTGDFRWYQVRKNDRYVSIAREQMGDESRWREIFELNKDKFPDPNQIREGVRIKIPEGTR